jgi:hypothetical protein
LIGAIAMVTSLLVAPAEAGASPVWSLVSSPNYSGTHDNNVLEGVSCVSARSCEAVGYHVIGRNAQRTLAESWNGSVWSLASSPNIGTDTTVDSNVLEGVSCVSARSCEAVGVYFNDQGGYLRTVVESWNGSAWSLTSSPNRGWNDNYLDSVSCVSASSCKAVGGYVNASGVQRTLVESWNGSVWSLASSPNHGTHNNVLRGVSCLSASSCKSVGGYVNGSGVVRTLVESWNGSVWSLAASPNDGTHDNELGLGGVSCVWARSCKAVGYYLNDRNVQRTLVESWNGSVWSLAASPNDGTHNNVLLGVSCVSARSCEAVGNYRNGSGAQWTLVESWNGSVWSLASSPNDGNELGLGGVSCVSARSCKAVGYYGNGANVQRTLVESYG